MILTKKALLKELQFNTERVPFNGGETIVSEISAESYMKMCLLCAENGEEDIDKDGNIRIDMTKMNAALIVYCVVDEKGKRIFEDSDLESLINLPYRATKKLVITAKRLNGLLGTEGNASEPTEGGSTTGE